MPVGGRGGKGVGGVQSYGIRNGEFLIQQLYFDTRIMSIKDHYSCCILTLLGFWTLHKHWKFCLYSLLTVIKMVWSLSISISFETRKAY